jgi:hypothetical protein
MRCVQRANALYHLVIILLIVGCTSTKQTVMPTQTAIITPVLAFTQKTATVRVTPTITPSLTVTSTATRTPTPVSTPFSTIAPREREQYVHRLNTLNEICALPCWGMIQPGKTRYEDIEPYLQSLTSDYGWEAYSINDVISNEEIHVRFAIKNHYIVEMYFPGGSYDLSEFLLQVGIPEEIWIRQNYGTPYGIPFWHYEIILFYPSRGILEIFTGESDVPSVEQAKICPLKEYKDSPLEPEKGLFLWAPNYVNEFSEIEGNENWAQSSPEYFHQISEVTDIGAEEFYQIYSDRTRQDECFSIDIFKYMEFVDIVTPTP